MTAPIQVGDLVVVVKWPCCGRNLGRIARVSNIDYRRNMECAGCKASNFPMPNADFQSSVQDGLICAPVEWLRRIDPLREPERELIEAEA